MGIGVNRKIVSQFKNKQIRLPAMDYRQFIMSTPARPDRLRKPMPRSDIVDAIAYAMASMSMLDIPDGCLRVWDDEILSRPKLCGKSCSMIIMDEISDCPAGCLEVWDDEYLYRHI